MGRRKVNKIGANLIKMGQTSGDLNKPRTVAVDDALWAAVQAAARAEGVSASEWVRRELTVACSAVGPRLAPPSTVARPRGPAVAIVEAAQLVTARQGYGAGVVTGASSGVRSYSKEAQVARSPKGSR